MTTNPTLMNATNNFIALNSTFGLFNLTCYVMKTIYNHMIQYEIRIPESPDDYEYRRVAFRSRIEWKKILDGIRGNTLIEHVFERLIKSVDFNLTPPYRPGYKRFVNAAIIALPYLNTRHQLKMNISSDFGNKKWRWLTSVEFENGN